MPKFTDVFLDVTKDGHKIPKESYLEEGEYPIIDQGQEYIAGYSNKSDGLYTDVPAIIFGDHTRVIKYVDMPFFLGADGVKLLKAKDADSNYKYLYYALCHAQIPDTGYNRHFKWLKEVDLRLPDKNEQQHIVEVLDMLGNLISLRKQQLAKLDELVKARFVEMFGEPVSNPMGWDKRPLSELMTNANNGMARRGNDPEGSIVMRLVELQDGHIDYSAPNRIILTDIEKRKYLLRDGDLLFARVNGNPEYVGRCAVFQEVGEPIYHNDHLIRVHFNDDLLNGSFASALLNSAYGKRQMRGQIKTSAGQYTISQDGIGTIVVVVPPLELQNKFAAFVEQTDRSKLTIQQSLDKLEILKKSLKHYYFERKCR